MYCPKCGNKQNENERFCPKCGTEFPSSNEYFPNSQNNKEEALLDEKAEIDTQNRIAVQGNPYSKLFENKKIIFALCLVVIIIGVAASSGNEEESTSKTYSTTTTATTSEDNSQSSYSSKNYTQSQDYSNSSSNQSIVGAWHGSLPGMSGLTWRFYGDGTLKVSASGQFIGYGTYKMINDYKVVVTCFDMSLEFRILSPGQMETSNGIILTK